MKGNPAWFGFWQKNELMKDPNPLNRYFFRNQIIMQGYILSSRPQATLILQMAKLRSNPNRKSVPALILAKTSLQIWRLMPRKRLHSDCEIALNVIGLHPADTATTLTEIGKVNENESNSNRDLVLISDTWFHRSPSRLNNLTCVVHRRDPLPSLQLGCYSCTVENYFAISCMILWY